MRRKGYSIRHISHYLGVAKASVSIWVRDIKMSRIQINTLAAAPYTRSAVEKRRISRMNREEAERTKVIENAKKTIKKISKRELFYVGIALYWGEGTKKKRGVVEVTNSDPLLIRTMVLFFLTICNVPKEKLRGHVFVHEHMNRVAIEKYWSSVSGIPQSQFHKTTIQKNRNRLVNDSIPFGTFAVIICDTQLKLKITGWIKGLGCNI